LMVWVTNFVQGRYELIKFVLFETDAHLEQVISVSRRVVLPATRYFYPGMLLGKIIPTSIEGFRYGELHKTKDKDRRPEHGERV
jgi:hypothetical protein